MKALKVAVAVMGVLIVFGTIALVVVVAQRLTTASAPARFETAAIAAADGRVLLLQRDAAGRARLGTLDAATGAVLRVGPPLAIDASAGE